MMSPAWSRQHAAAPPLPAARRQGLPGQTACASGCPPALETPPHMPTAGDHIKLAGSSGPWRAGGRHRPAPLLAALGLALVLLALRGCAGGAAWRLQLGSLVSRARDEPATQSDELLRRLAQRPEQQALERRWGVEPVLQAPAPPPGTRIPRILHHGVCGFVMIRWAWGASVGAGCSAPGPASCRGRPALRALHHTSRCCCCCCLPGALRSLLPRRPRLPGRLCRRRRRRAGGASAVVPPPGGRLVCPACPAAPPNPFSPAPSRWSSSCSTRAISMCYGIGPPPPSWWPR